MKFFGVVIIGTLIFLGLRHYRWLHEWFCQWLFQWKQAWVGVVVGKFAYKKEGFEIEHCVLELCYNQRVRAQEVTVSTWRRVKIGDYLKKSARRSSVASHVLSPEEAQRVTAVLVERLSLEDDEERFRTVDAIGQMGVLDELVMSALVKILKDDSERLRCRAAAVLGGKNGEATQVVVTALIEALSDESARVRMNAAWALGEVDSRSATLVSALRTTLKGDDDPKVRFNSLQALKKKGTPESIQGIKANRNVGI